MLHASPGNVPARVKVRREAWDVRYELEGRPSLFALLGLIVGLTSVSHPVNLLALLALIWLRSLAGRCWCAGLFIVGLALSPVQPVPLVGREFIADSGTVSSTIRREGQAQSCRVRLSRGEFSLSVTDGPQLSFGDQISVKGVAVPVGASEEQESRRLTLGTIRSGPGDIFVVRPKGTISGIADAWRVSFEQFVAASLPPEASATVRASVFGVDDAPQSLVRRLRSAGAVSLASVSGLQVLLLGSLALTGASRLPVSRASALVVLSAVLFVYAEASGLHAGVIRASVMTLMLSAAYLFRRDPDVLSALALSAVLELLWRPSWIYEFGFQLSFIVVGTLALWLPGRSRLSSGSIWLRGLSVAASIVAMFLAAAPLVAYQTGELKLQSPLMGAIILPSIAPMFVFSLGAWALSFLSSGLGAICMRWLVAPFAGWVLACSDFASSAGALSVHIPPFSAYLLAPVYVLVALGARITSNAFSGERS